MGYNETGFESTAIDGCQLYPEVRMKGMKLYMTTNEFYFTSSNGIQRVFAKEWLPPEEPVAILLIAHGMAEHIERYAEFASFLAEYGILVAGADHCGHGKSVRTPDDLGFFAEEGGWNLLVENLHRLRSIEEEAHPGLPVFLLGHSMGSFVARTYIMEHGDGLAGVLLCGTGEVPAPAIRAGRALAALERKKYGSHHRSSRIDQLCFGSFNKPFAPNRTRFDWLTRDAAIVDQYCADPYCGFVFTVAAFQDLFYGLSYIQNRRNLAKILPSLPVFLFSGSEDPVGGCGRGVQKVAHAMLDVGVKNVTVKLYAGGRHEVLNERNRGQVYSDVLTWIENRL